MSTTNTILPETAEAEEPVTNERLPRCRRLIREARVNRALAIAGPRMQSRCTAESVADEPPYLCASHLSEAMRFLVDRGVAHVAVLCDQQRRQAAAVNELMVLAGRADNATTLSEQVAMNQEMVDVARRELEERRARSNRLIQDLLAPAQETTASETLDEATVRQQVAEAIVQERVDAGHLVRLSGGRVIEADRYDPAVHGARLGPEVDQ